MYEFSKPNKFTKQSEHKGFVIKHSLDYIAADESDIFMSLALYMHYFQQRIKYYECLCILNEFKRIL